MSLPNGARLGRYEIRSKIGAGGMGEVYLAQDTTLDRPVALKRLPADVAAVPDRMSRFVQEARAASSLNHPNIITIHDIDQSGSEHFIATEFVDGDTLREVMRVAPLPLHEVLDICTQVASALAAAHDAGIVHRDIKPDNIMRRRDGLVKVLDFGLAKLSTPNEATGRPVETAAPTAADLATAPGTVLGTALYMSPEQARGLTVDARSDIFSLGLVLYELLTHRLPFEGANANEILASLLGDRAPQPLARFASGVPPELERIVSKALRKNRDERYQNVKDLLLDLKSLMQSVELEKRASVAGTAARPTTTDATRDAGVASRRQASARVWLLAGAVTLGLAGALAGWTMLRRATPPVATAIDSIAVLPFENRTHDDAVDYLADGVTDSLINSLSQLPHTRVIARNSVFGYKNQTPRPRDVGRQLDVRAVLTGRVMTQGDTLDVRAELTDASTDAQLWGDHYTRKMTDLFAVQDEIARQVTDALRVHLNVGEQRQITKHYTDNAEAYQLYLQGRYFFNAGAEEDMNRAMGFFDRAVALDPRFALAYVARGEAYFMMGDLSLPMNEAVARARENVLKALSLDEALPGARVLLATITFQYDWKFAEAEKEFTRVIAMDPNDAEAHHQYAYLLALTGRPGEAIEQFQRARQLDPVNPSIVSDVGLPYFLSRRYGEAAAAGRKALDVFPKFFLPHMAVGSALLELGDVKAGLDELEQARALEPTPIVLGNLGYAYAKAGRQADARALLAQLKAQSGTRYVASYWSALIHGGLGERDEAFASLDKAYEARSWWILWINTDPRFDALRSDARFTELVRRVGFP